MKRDALYAFGRAGLEPGFNPQTGEWDAEIASHIAKFPYVILNGFACADFPDAVAKLRALAPDSTLIGYFMPLCFPTLGRKPDSYYRKHMERFSHAYVESPYCDVDLGKLTGQDVDDMAEMIEAACDQLDGAFLDIMWPNNPLGGSQWRWTVNFSRVFDRLCEDADGWIVAGNAGNPIVRGVSWMRENAPYQVQGGTLAAMLLDASNALLGPSGQGAIIKTDADMRLPWDHPANLQRARVGLACAYLCDGIAIYSPGHPDESFKPWTWRLPEYEYELGNALGPPELGPGAVARREFEGGAVAVNFGSVAQRVPMSGKLEKVAAQSGAFVVAA